MSRRSEASPRQGVSASLAPGALGWGRRQLCETRVWQDRHGEAAVLCPAGRKSPKNPLQHWSIHLWPSCPEYPKDFSVKQANGRTCLPFPCKVQESTSQCLVRPVWATFCQQLKRIQFLAQCHFATFDTNSTGDFKLHCSSSLQWTGGVARSRPASLSQ